VLGLLGVFLLGACGSSGAKVSGSAATALQPDVNAVRASVAAGDSSASQRALDALRRHVEQLRAAHTLTDGGASNVLQAADAVAKQLLLLPPPTIAPAPPVNTNPPDTQASETRKRRHGRD